MDEAQLVKLLQDSNTREEGFRVLISTYKERIYWHIRKIVGSHDEADDVVQNTFIKIFRNIESFKGNSKLYTWMYRIATNESMTHLAKKSKIQKSQSELEVVHNTKTFVSEDNISSDKTIEYLMTAVGQLPPKQRAVFNMKYFEEMSYKEMSEIMETSEGALKASYHHATNKIKELLVQSIHTNA